MPMYDDVVHAVNNILLQYTVKLTLRQVYYRLVAADVIKNNMNSYKTLSKWLVKARERGEVDDERFEDRARYTEGGDSGWDNPDEFIDFLKRNLVESWKRYGRRSWEGQDHYVECWIEKDALARLISDVAKRYSVITCVARGYSSYTFLNEAATRIQEFADMGRTPTILYFGDFDPNFICLSKHVKGQAEKTW